MEYKVFEVKIDDNLDDIAVNFISLVDYPAMEVDFMALSAEKPIMFKGDPDKKMLYGVFILADKLVWRNGIDGYVKFTSENIEKIIKKFNKAGLSRNINFDHSDRIVSAFVVENWQVDGEQDKIHNYVKGVTQGSWVGSVYVEDQEFWNDYVKTGEVRGFSIEITNYDLKETATVKEEFSNENILIDRMYQILSTESDIESIIKKIREIL